MTAFRYQAVGGNGAPVRGLIEAEDRKASGAITANVSGGFHEQLGASTGLGLSLLAESATYLRYSGLSNLGLGARAQLRQKFGVGGDTVRPYAMLGL
jgi:hypothetical protein